MGRMFLVCRLAVRDVGRRRGEAAMLVLVMMAATTALTLGLVLHGATAQPYAATRAATAGPDVIAVGGTTQDGVTTPAALAALQSLKQAPGVTHSSGPYPVTTAVLRFGGITGGAEVEGRDANQALVDQPKMTQGGWVRPGGVVVERSFADALGVHVGDAITLNGRSFQVAGVAVTAALPPFPQICRVGCNLPYSQTTSDNTGLMWLTRADVQSLATPMAPLSYFINLKLADPAEAQSFADSRNVDSPSSTAPFLTSWESISQQDAKLVKSEQLVMLVGSWLLAILAVASVAVLVGGRMAEQLRRVGLLKAVGATPGLVAAVLLAEYLALAVVAAVIGLVVGWSAAPLLTGPGAGLLGTPGAPPLTVVDVGVVVLVAVAVAAVAAVVPAFRSARTSTIRALADTARPPRRRALLVNLSARLPVPLLLAVRVAARRPRRAVLHVLSIAVTVSGVVAVAIAHARLSGSHLVGSSGLDNPRTDRANEVLLVITVMLIALAAVNAVFITRATAQDSRHLSAVTRALGATPDQITAGLSLAQVLPALAGALLGIPGGIGLYASVKHGGTMAYPSIGWLIAVVVGTLVVVAGLTAVPARVAGRRPVAEILQAESA